MLTPQERSLRARKAAHGRWSRENPELAVARATAGFMQHFLDEVDPDEQLPVAERQRRADHAFKAHMLGLALKSAKARRERREQAASAAASSTGEQ